jgi:hypothetical protein
MTDILDRLKQTTKINGAYPKDIEDAINVIQELQQEIEKLREREYLYLWEKYPDRNGGAFTQDEINESGTWK